MSESPSRAKSSYRRSTSLVIALGAVALWAPPLFGGAHAFAASKSSDKGLFACFDWCDAHNKTQKSDTQCRLQCAKYWGGHSGLTTNGGTQIQPPKPVIGGANPGTLGGGTSNSTPPKPVVGGANPGTGCADPLGCLKHIRH